MSDDLTTVNIKAEIRLDEVTGLRVHVCSLCGSQMECSYDGSWQCEGGHVEGYDGVTAHELPVVPAAGRSPGGPSGSEQREALVLPAELEITYRGEIDRVYGADAEAEFFIDAGDEVSITLRAATTRPSVIREILRKLASGEVDIAGRPRR